MHNELQRYVDEVLRFRKALNLTSVADRDAFWQRFIQPSLDLLPMMPASGRMMDIGSGMGVPGIPLMIARPALFGVLVERRKKRAEFLRHVIRSLRLHGEAHDTDVRQLPCAQIDVFTARAVTEPPALLRMCEPHASPAACAVLPVAQAFDGSAPSGWKIESEVWTDAAQPQRLICFRWQGGVSRET